MTQAIMKESYVSDNNQIKVILETSIDAGYPNECTQYAPYGLYSIPLNNAIVNVEQQSLTNVVVTGYNFTIQDNNYNEKSSGTIAMCSPSWYNINSINGCLIQQANTSNKEPQMMGNSTNQVLVDIINFLLTLLTINPQLTKPDLNTLNNDLTNLNHNSNLATSSYKPKSQW